MGSGLHGAALHMGTGNLRMVVPGGPETASLPHAKLSTLVSLFRDHAAGPHPLLPRPLRALGEVGCWGFALLGSPLTLGPVTCVWPSWPGNRAWPNLPRACKLQGRPRGPRPQGVAGVVSPGCILSPTLCRRGLLVPHPVSSQAETEAGVRGADGGVRLGRKWQVVSEPQWPPGETRASLGTPVGRDPGQPQGPDT